MKYFVLKPKGITAYHKASRAAMNVYARQIAAENPQLSKELREWAFNEMIESQDDDIQIKNDMKFRQPKIKV